MNKDIRGYFSSSKSSLIAAATNSKDISNSDSEDSDVYNSFTVNLNLESKASYINILTLKLPQIQPQSIYFSGGHAPRSPLALACYAC